MDTKQQGTRNSGAYVGAVLLIVIGLAALVANLGGDKYIYEAIPLAAGVAFFVAYASTRQYGFLVPAGILSGIGAGLLASSVFNATDQQVAPYLVDGIGLGFLSIFAIDVLVTRTAARWWPLIPGGVMVVIGSSASLTRQQVTDQVGIWVALFLIVLGVAMLFTRTRRGTS
jgi:hypothetical protein